MAELKLNALTKRFGAAAVVDNVCLDVADSELIALLGPSGCGKTTTLRMVAGFMPPSAGEISVGGRVLSTPTMVVPPAQRHMSMIFQSYALWPHMTIFDNVAFGMRMRKKSAAEIDGGVRRVLAAVQLQDMADRYPAELSGGQQQRIALARAVVVEPETLLLDEPLSNLDANLREEMRFEIRRLHDEFRITSIYVTHDLSEAMVTADRIVVMNGGRIEQVGRPEEIYDRPLTTFVAAFIGANNIVKCSVHGHWAHFGSARLALGEDADVHRGNADLRESRGEDARSMSIRPHDIELFAADRRPDDSSNLLGARVRRQTYLGHARDYIVDLDNSGISLRVTERPDVSHSPGAAVWLRIAPRNCRLLADSAPVMASVVEPGSETGASNA